MSALSNMLLETKASSAAVERLFARSRAAIDALAQVLIIFTVRAAVTVARGSLGHAPSHRGYLLLSRMDMLITSLPPSAITPHHAPIQGDGLAALSVAQSGQRPDLIESMTNLAAPGAVTVAFVNDTHSPLAKAVRHGPMALIEAAYPVLMLAPRGPGQAELIALAGELRERGVRVPLAADSSHASANLCVVSAAHEALDTVSVAQSFYPMIEALAPMREHDPDRPPHLNKVTKMT